MGIKMQEYWANVYQNKPPYYSLSSKSREECINNCRVYGGGANPIYRIHVKLDGGYNKHRIEYKRQVQALKLSGYKRYFPSLMD